MHEMKLMVPTYNGTVYESEVNAALRPEFGDPSMPVLVREAGGVRIVLGTHYYEDMDKPDVHIERQPNGWLIFLHPMGGGDPSGCVYFLDDGRSFVVVEDCGGPPLMDVLNAGDKVPAFDPPI